MEQTETKRLKFVFYRDSRIVKTKRASIRTKSEIESAASYGLLAYKADAVSVLNGRSQRPIFVAAWGSGKFVSRWLDPQ